MVRPWLVPALNFRGLPLSVQGCSSLGCPLPEGSNAAHRPAAEYSPCHPPTTSTLACARSGTVSTEASAGRVDAVPKLNLQGVRPSVQGYASLGILPPELGECESCVPTPATPPDAPLSRAGVGPAVPGNLSNSPRAGGMVSRCRAWSIPRLNFFGLPPSPQGWLDLALRTPEGRPSSPSSRSASMRELSGSSNYTPSVTSSAEVEAAADETAVPVPPLNLEGLPPPRTLIEWAGLPLGAHWEFWWSDLQQLMLQAAEPNRVPQLPSVPWYPTMECSQCAICLTDFESQSSVSRLPCKHIFHEGCICQWLVWRTSCPICRADC